MDGTRKRFLQLIGTSAGVSLAGCGYGFVPSNMSSPKDPLTLVLSDAQRRSLQFFHELKDNVNLQNLFINDPSNVLISRGFIDSGTKASISRANHLLFYVLSNESLQNDVAAIALESEPTRKAARIAQNEFTTDNPNIAALDKLNRAVVNAPDRREVLEKQIYILISDVRFCELAGIELEPGDRRDYANKLASRAQDLELGKVNPLFPTFNLNLIFNVNAIFNANAYANANVNTNLNANTNANWNCQTNFDGHGHCPPHYADGRSERWHHFISALVDHAKSVEAGGE